MGSHFQLGKDLFNDFRRGSINGLDIERDLLQESTSVRSVLVVSTRQENLLRIQVMQKFDHLYRQLALKKKFFPFNLKGHDSFFFVV